MSAGWRYAYAQLLLFAAQNARALTVLQDVVREVPEHAGAWALIGFLKAQGGALSESIEAFERAVAVGPVDAALLFNSAFNLQRAGRHLEAIERFRRAIEFDSRVDRAWYGLGLSLAHERRDEEAIAPFREAARLQPLNPHAGYQLGAVYFRLGRHDEMLSEYERVKQFDPSVSSQMRREFGLGP